MILVSKAARLSREVITMLFAAALLANAGRASVGFQEATVPDRNGSAIRAGIGSPSNSEASSQALLISHGTG